MSQNRAKREDWLSVTPHIRCGLNVCRLDFQPFEGVPCHSDMCFPVICVPRTHITSDMCFPGRETQNTEAIYPSLQMA